MNKIFNSISKPFEAVFAIMFGTILVDAFKNIVIAYQRNNSDVLILTFILCFYFFLSAFETLLDFQFAEKHFDNIKKAKYRLRCYLVWFAQFVPFAFIIIYSGEKVIAPQYPAVVSLSLMSVYLCYAIINILWFKIWPLVVYLSISLIYLAYYFVRERDPHLYILDAAIVLSLIVYFVYWWKPYFRGRLFADTNILLEKDLGDEIADLKSSDNPSQQTKDKNSSFGKIVDWAQVAATIIAAAGLFYSIQTFKDSTERRDKNIAFDYWQKFLEFSAKHGDLANGEPLKESLVNYDWYVSYALGSCEQIYQYKKDDAGWKNTIRNIVLKHKKYIDSNGVDLSTFNLDFQNFMQSAIKSSKSK